MNATNHALCDPSSSRRPTETEIARQSKNRMKVAVPPLSRGNCREATAAMGTTPGRDAESPDFDAAPFPVRLRTRITAPEPGQGKRLICR